MDGILNILEQLDDVTDNIEEIDDKEKKTTTEVSNTEEITKVKEVTKEVETTEGNEEITTKGDDKVDEMVTAVTALLKENKVLENNANITTYEDIVNELARKDEDVVKSYVSNLPEEIKTLIELGVSGVATTEVSNSVLKIGELKKIDIDKADVDTYKRLMQEGLKLEGYQKEYIKKRIEGAEDTDTLKYEATIFKKRLTSRYESEIENRKKEEETRILQEQEDYKKWYSNIESGVNDVVASRYGLHKNNVVDILDKVVNPIIVKDNKGNEHTTHYLENAFNLDPLLIPEVIYLIESNRIGAKATNKLARTSKSNAIKEIEKAYLKGKTQQQGNENREDFQVPNFKLN